MTFSFALRGLSSDACTHGLRRGLYSNAASRLISFERDDGDATAHSDWHKRAHPTISRIRRTRVLAKPVIPETAANAPMGRGRRPISCGSCVRGARRAERTQAPGLSWARPGGCDWALGRLAKPCVARLVSNRQGIRRHGGLKKQQRVRSSFPSGSSKTATENHAGKLCRSGSASSAKLLVMSPPRGCLIWPDRPHQAKGGSHRNHFIHSGGMGPVKERTRSHLNFEFAPVFVVNAP